MSFTAQALKDFFFRFKKNKQTERDGAVAKGLIDDFLKWFSPLYINNEYNTEETSAGTKKKELPRLSTKK